MSGLFYLKELMIIKLKSNKIVPTAALMVIVAAMFGWSLYRLSYQVLTDILLSMGIVGDYWQNIIILAVMGLILILGGKKITDAIS